MKTTDYINRDLNYDGSLTIEEYVSRRRDFVPGRFDGKVAIVTGGTSGIGFSAAQELGREGARLAITGRNPETGKKAVEELEKEGIEVIYFAGDMKDSAFCKRIADETYLKYGRIDCLVNNAFLFIMHGLDAEDKDWDDAFFTGLVGYARMIQNVVPYMEKNGGGSIVNVSSISGHIAQTNFWTYSMMKGAVGQLTKCAALDLARMNIRVNSISPATIFTRITSQALYEDDRKARRARMKAEGQGYMLNRAGEPVECASTILFLLSDDASYVTGSDYLVDGGFISLGSQGSLQKVYRDREKYKLEYSDNIMKGLSAYEDEPY